MKRNRKDRVRLFLSVAAAAAVVLAMFISSSPAGANATGNWQTYLYNGARTGDNKSETVITSSTAANLKPQWTDSTGSVSAEPVAANGSVYYGSWDGHEYAVSASTGAQIWSAYLGRTTDTNCNPPTVGVASTATVGTVAINGTATQVLFVGGGDGHFYALNASTGAVIWKTELGKSPDTFLWSSPLLYGGSIYEGVASFGDCPLIRGGIVRISASTGAIQNTLYTVPAGCTGASVWGSPAVDSSTGDIYFATGNPGSCSSSEPLAEATVQASRSLSLLSSWHVPASQEISDGDFGSTPTLFHVTIGGVGHQMVGVQNKNGIFYAFDRASISSGPLWQRRVATGGACPQCNAGKADISPAAYDGSRLYVAGEKTYINGTLCPGSIRAVQAASGQFAWQDCLPAPVLGAVTMASGVAFVPAGNTVYAIDSGTGKRLWTHQDTTNGSQFWGAASISNGIAYIGNQDGRLYAFAS